MVPIEQRLDASHIGVRRSKGKMNGFKTVMLLAAMTALVPAAIELLEQPNPYLRANGYAVATAAIALLAWPLIRWQRGVAHP